MRMRTTWLLGVVSVLALVGCRGMTAGDGGDAAVDAPPPPLVPNPGLVSCGPVVCDAAVECFVSFEDGGGSCFDARDPLAACPVVDARTFNLTCDELGDCALDVGSVCCLYPNHISGCERSCFGPKLCKVDQDCVDPQVQPPVFVPCIPQPCSRYSFGVCGQLLEPDCSVDAGP